MSTPATSKVSDKDLRLLIDNVRDYAIFLLNADGTVATWSAGARRLQGYSPAEIIGKHFSIFYPPEDVKAGKPAMELREAAREGRYEDEGWRLRKDGSRFWANVIITALRDEAGQVRGFGKISRDLSERRKSEDDLRQAYADLEKRAQEKASELFEAIRALSTPVLPVRPHLLVLPLIGLIDSARALQFTEQLLTAIRTYRARAVVLDITGVLVVDSKVANHLLQTVEAARLMGTSVIVTGISSEIAQTLVRIGVDLTRLTTATDLRAGLEQAEAVMGYQVVRLSEPPA
jgi:PAS domain S-box-containing protein